MRVIYIWSGPEFWGYSRSEVRNFKFHQQQPLQLYLCFFHIAGKFDLHQSGWSIYHPDTILKEISDLKSEISNFIHSIYIWQITVLTYTLILYYDISWNPTVRITCQTYKQHMSIYWSQKVWYFVKYFTTVLSQ